MFLDKLFMSGNGLFSGSLVTPVDVFVIDDSGDYITTDSGDYIIL